MSGPKRRRTTGSPSAPQPDPHAERVRPRDPFLRFFQDCVIAMKREPDGDREYDLESFLDRKAGEFGVPTNEIRPVRRIASYVARTPIALVEVTRPVGTDPEDGATLVSGTSFCVPAYGDFLGVVAEKLGPEGYERVHSSEGETGELAGVVLEHPETGVAVAVRTYPLEPMAQGPEGFKEWVRIYADALDGEDEEAE